MTTKQINRLRMDLIYSEIEIERLIKELDQLSDAYISLKDENKILMLDVSILKDIALERYKEIEKLTDVNKVLELKLSNLINSQLENQKANKNERN